MKILMVAEKPSLAESIASILSKKKSKSRRGVACNVHEYTGNFKGQSAKFCVTSVMGHVFSVDFTKEYNNWDAVDPLELFEGDIVKQEANPKSHIVKHLQVEAKGADYLILWLDCDREGENICFEVIKSVKSSMNKTKNSKWENILRAKFSAITEKDIFKAMENLGVPNENQSKAVDVRQELDLKIGCAFTRFQTRYFQGKYGNLDSSVISFGPCQTPTLALCVKRHDDILSFVPRKFWTLGVLVRLGDSSGNISIRMSSLRGRMFEKKKSQDVKQSLTSFKKAKIINVINEKKSTQRPNALNTVEMLKSASTRLGISPQQAMHIAERLYMSGYISYPRTETTKYPVNFDFKTIVKTLSDQPVWGRFASDLLKEGITRPEGGKDLGDHPPMYVLIGHLNINRTPMMVATEYDLTGDSWRLYDLVSRHFLASLSPNCKYLRTQVIIAVGTEQFKCVGKNDLFVDDEEDNNLEEGEARQREDSVGLPVGLDKLIGSEIELSDIYVKEGETSPPGHLTESDLIGLMEKLGIGTDASMAVHIENICSRRYVNVQGSKRLMVPSDLEIVLIHGYQKIDPELALPTLRSQMEKKIDLIANGTVENSKILNEVLAAYRQKFITLTSKIDKMDELFEATFSPLAGSGKVFSKCGKCRRYMHFINLRPQRLHCRTCNETYSLPQLGNIKLFKELKCPLDNFELVVFSTGSKGKGFPVCPHCYNHPPFENVESNMSCNLCYEKDCSFSFVNTWVSRCTEEKCTGMLVLDSTSAPRWKICCNKCTLVVSFQDSVHEVKIELENQSPAECNDCAEQDGIISRLLHITFGKKSEIPFLESVCIVCDEEVEELLETKIVRLGTRRRGRGGRGRGRGRGRRGRGRGRGKSRGRGH